MKTDGIIGGGTILKKSYDKDLTPFLDDEFDIVSPFRSFEENIRALTEANITGYQMKLELELLESYMVNQVIERYNFANENETYKNDSIRTILVIPTEDYELYLAFSKAEAIAINIYGV